MKTQGRQVEAGDAAQPVQVPCGGNAQHRGQLVFAATHITDAARFGSQGKGIVCGKGKEGNSRAEGAFWRIFNDSRRKCGPATDKVERVDLLQAGNRCTGARYGRTRYNGGLVQEGCESPKQGMIPQGRKHRKPR
ncbi:hypothetical protein AGMMS50233_06460 [Endomicrobiia bacterium]|nr:hypothetical protein AGMMS50233_06460 [Endomicrobiia bacterium]